MRKLIFFTALLATFVWGNYKYFTAVESFGDFYKDTGQKCGIVVDDFTQLCNVKHGTRTEYFLKVQYGANAVIEEVGAKTYYAHAGKVGSEICFGTSEQIAFAYIFLVGADIILALAAVVFGLVLLIGWIFEVDWG